MKRPIEHEYNSFVSYARELEKYCSELESAAQQALNALKGWPGKPRAAFEILTAALKETK